MDGVSSESSSLPSQATFLGEERRDLTAHQLVGDWLLAVGIQFVRVGHLPGSAGAAIIIGHCLTRGREFGLLGIEGVAILVLGAANFALSPDSVHLENGIVGAVDVRVYPHAEQVLVVVRIDTRVDFGSPALSILAGVHGISVENAGKLDVQLNCAVLVEDPVDAVLVVGGGEDLRDDKLPSSGDNN